MHSRRKAREQALQVLYGIAIGKGDPAAMLDDIVGKRADQVHRLFVRSLVFGVLEHADELDEHFSPLLQGWSLERLPTIDRLLLRLGTFELYHHPQTPSAVVINEAVDLAKEFSTEDSGRFVNGVLGAVAREHAGA